MPALTAHEFESRAREAMSGHFQTDLRPGVVEGVPKRFDLVSGDKRIVGDAKFYTLVGGTRLPPAKFSVIAEYVWLLEKTRAQDRFLVFGNDERVPCEWLRRYGHLAEDLHVFFLSQDGKLVLLKEAKA